MLIKIDSEMIDQLCSGDIIIQDNEKYRVHALTDLTVMAMNLEAGELKMLPKLNLSAEEWYLEKTQVIQNNNLKTPLRSSL